MPETWVTINLVMGDESNDGHEKRERRTIKSNLTIGDLNKAYNKGVKKVKFDLVEDCCSEYEDNVLSKKNYNKLVKCGFECDWKDYQDSKGNFSIFADEFVDLYLFICSLGNPDFKYEFINYHESELYIGGYGLFF